MMDDIRPRDRMRRRLDRQFEALARAVPISRGPIRSLTKGYLSWLRIPLGLLLILGGFLSFLPILGLWMLPLGLLLLAVDLPPLRPVVSTAAIRLRRRILTLRRRMRLARRRRRR